MADTASSEASARRGVGSAGSHTRSTGVDVCATFSASKPCSAGPHINSALGLQRAVSGVSTEEKHKPNLG